MSNAHRKRAFIFKSDLSRSRISAHLKGRSSSLATVAMSFIIGGCSLANAPDDPVAPPVEEPANPAVQARQCASNEFELSPPTANTDRQCRPVSECSDDEFEAVAPSATSNRVCKAATKCAATQFEAAAPTAKTDRVCDALTTCSAEEFETEEPTAKSDRVCQEFTKCAAGQFETEEPTAKSDRACQEFTECTADEYEGREPTALRDRACFPLTKLTASSHTCRIFSGGRVKCWGLNSAAGQLGLGHRIDLGDGPNEMGNSLPFVDLGSGGLVAQSISSGHGHNCVVFDDGKVKCWGQNDNGQLGQGDEKFRGGSVGEMGDALPFVNLGGRTAKDVIAGFHHSCALLDDGQVVCWGRNSNGQLGQGHSDNLGDDPNEMGGNLPVVDLGKGRTAQSISAKGNFTCALLDNDHVTCWGANFGGQLGQGHTKDLGDDPNEMGDKLSVVDLGTDRTAKQIVAGLGAACALLDDDTVKCWGTNFGGQLGQGHTNSLGDNPGELGDNLTAVALGTGRTAQSIVVNGTQACALLDNDSIKCWGSNFSGELGQGHIENLGDNPGELGDALAPIDLGTGLVAKGVHAGFQHACVILTDEKIKCWGNNSLGQLGQGHTENLGDNPGEMGNTLPFVDLGN